MMKLHFHLPLLCGLAMGMSSCEKPAEESTTSPSEVPTRRPIRPSPRDGVGPEITRSGLRDSLGEAIAMPTASDRDDALESIIEEAVELDPELACEAFDQLSPASTSRDQMVEHFAMRLAEQDLDRAVTWAGSLKSDEERSLAFGNVALVLSSDDPAAAAKLLSDSGVASRNFDVAVVQVLQRWASQSPADAAAWVVSFDPGESRTAGIKVVLSAWIEQDLAVTYRWIQAIPDNETRAEAINGLAESILERPEIEQAKLLQSAPNEIRLRHEELTTQADGVSNEND